MKVLNYIGNPRRLFVPVYEFQFVGFTSQVRHLTSRQLRAPLPLVGGKDSGQGTLAFGSRPKWVADYPPEAR